MYVSNCVHKTEKAIDKSENMAVESSVDVEWRVATSCGSDYVRSVHVYLLRCWCMIQDLNPSSRPGPAHNSNHACSPSLHANPHRSAPHNPTLPGRGHGEGRHDVGEGWWVELASGGSGVIMISLIALT